MPPDASMYLKSWVVGSEVLQMNSQNVDTGGFCTFAISFRIQREMTAMIAEDENLTYNRTFYDPFAGWACLLTVPSL